MNNTVFSLKDHQILMVRHRWKVIYSTNFVKIFHVVPNEKKKSEIVPIYL